MWRRKRYENLSGRPLVPVQSFASRGEITGGKVGHRPIRFSRTRLYITGAKGNRHLKCHRNEIFVSSFIRPIYSFKRA